MGSGLSKRKFGGAIGVPRFGASRVCACECHKYREPLPLAALNEKERKSWPAGDKKSHSHSRIMQLQEGK